MMKPRTRRVLVVDDDEPLLGTLRDVLGGYEVHTAGNSEQALDLLWDNDYDVIVSDVRMPGIDGRGLHVAIAAHLPQFLPRLILITGDWGNRETVEFLAGTPVPVLRKPFDMVEFLGRVEFAMLVNDRPGEMASAAAGRGRSRGWSEE